MYAQNNLGVMYYSGEGVEQDYARAAELYGKAAEQGHMYAQYNLGGMYYDGEGVEQDFARAAELFRKAADAGNNEAQIFLDAHDDTEAMDENGLSPLMSVPAIDLGAAPKSLIKKDDTNIGNRQEVRK